MAEFDQINEEEEKCDEQRDRQFDQRSTASSTVFQEKSVVINSSTLDIDELIIYDFKPSSEGNKEPNATKSDIRPHNSVDDDARRHGNEVYRKTSPQSPSIELFSCQCHVDESQRRNVRDRDCSHSGHKRGTNRIRTPEGGFTTMFAGKIPQKFITLHRLTKTKLARSLSYHCDVCGKDFSQKAHLIDHFRLHTGEKPYHYDFCGKDFSQRCSLVNHRRAHTGERPYHCNTCGKDVSQKAHLICHSRLHIGERPYHCNICGKDFTQQCSLTKRRRLHTE